MNRDRQNTGKNSMNEYELVQRCKRGDQTAFRTLFDMFSDRVFSTSLRMLGNRQDAEDASQQVFIKIFTSITAFRGGSSLVTWIYRITSNTCFDMLRKRKTTAETDPIESVEETLKADSGNPEIRNTLLEKEIQNLPQSARAVFILYAIEGFKHEEVAAILGISAGTSKSQYFAAKALLRKRLLPHKEALNHGM